MHTPEKQKYVFLFLRISIKICVPLDYLFANKMVMYSGNDYNDPYTLTYM